MSFQDLEAGRPLSSRRDRVNGKQDSTQAVASGIFQINTAVSTFQRLVNTLGTPKDTPELREKLSVPFSLSRFNAMNFAWKKNSILAYRLYLFWLNWIESLRSKCRIDFKAWLLFVTFWIRFNFWAKIVVDVCFWKQCWFSVLVLNMMI